MLVTIFTLCIEMKTFIDSRKEAKEEEERRKKKQETKNPLDDVSDEDEDVRGILTPYP